MDPSAMLGMGIGRVATSFILKRKRTGRGVEWDRMSCQIFSNKEARSSKEKSPEW
jgi:hypothetical protein